MGDTNKASQQIYSRFLSNVLTSRATIFINSLILSEYANRYLRIDFNLLQTKEGTQLSFKKDYVGSSRYQTTVSDITSSIKKILAICEKTTDNFNFINIDSLFGHFNEIDFNDSYIIELSRLNSYKLVTDDKDFTNYKKHNIEIITTVRS